MIFYSDIVFFQEFFFSFAVYYIERFNLDLFNCVSAFYGIDKASIETLYCFKSVVTHYVD